MTFRLVTNRIILFLIKSYSMKYLLIAFLILNETSTLCSQEDQIETKLNSFMKIPFGVNFDSVKLLKKEFDFSYERLSGYCRNCTFGKFSGSILLLFNSKGQFMGGAVELKPKDEMLVFDLYDDVVRTLTDKYGKPTYSLEKFTSPFDFEKKGREYPNLSIPTAKVSTGWVFSSEMNDNNECKISVKIDSDFSVNILYNNRTLAKEDLLKEKNKQNQDY